MNAGGGPEAFLDEHAVIVMSDHSQNPIETSVSLADALAHRRILLPSDQAPEDAEIAVCPGARSGQVYVLDEESRPRLTAAIGEELVGVDGVDLVAWRDDAQGVVRSSRGELRFAPGGELEDTRGGHWSVEGEDAVLDLTITAGSVRSGDYPHALGRLWSALNCPRGGDVLVSAEPGYEFADWGGHTHLGGGSHGSLHRCDSLGVLLMSGIGPERADERERWSIEDVTPMILDHFGIAA